MGVCKNPGPNGVKDRNMPGEPWRIFRAHVCGDFWSFSTKFRAKIIIFEQHLIQKMFSRQKIRYPPEARSYQVSARPKTSGRVQDPALPADRILLPLHSKIDEICD